MTTARDTEAQLIGRCVQIATSADDGAVDQREANVFRVAAMIIRQPYPAESERLMQVAGAYFAQHPADLLPAEEIVRHGWIFSFPRLHDYLLGEFEHTAKRVPYANHPCR